MICCFHHHPQKGFFFWKGREKLQTHLQQRYKALFIRQLENHCTLSSSQSSAVTSQSNQHSSLTGLVMGCHSKAPSRRSNSFFFFFALSFQMTSFLDYFAKVFHTLPHLVTPSALVFDCLIHHLLCILSSISSFIFCLLLQNLT